jgi:hypothetical protein
VERRFLTQALEAYRRNLPDASAIMLGCASEHLVLVLARALVAADPTAETKTQQLIDKGTAKQLLDHVSKRLDPRAGGRSLPWQLEEMRATHFNGVAQIVRVARNDAGHPARQQPVDRDHCLVLLRLFPQYRAWVTQVLTHL